MWQKINHWLTQHLLIAPLPIFAKMVLLYSSIVFFILLTVSVVTITSVHYIMNDSLRDELKSRAAAAIQYLDDYGKVDTTIFVRANVPPSMNLQIYDGAGHLIVDNGPTHAVRKLSDRYIDDAISRCPPASKATNRLNSPIISSGRTNRERTTTCAFLSAPIKKRASCRSYRNSSWLRSSSA